MKVLEHLLKAVCDAAIYNSDIQIAPACILWPDKDRQWESVLPRLQKDLSELFILGDYAPDKRTGPAIWLRCIIAKKNPEIAILDGKTPIIYLPGVSRQDLRAVESCPDELKPLAELQYRGVMWSQVNAKDWTILAFLKSNQGGLCLDVAQDNGTRNAMQLALYRLLDEEVEQLKGKRLDKDYFNTLLTGGDPIRDFLQWLDEENIFRSSRGDNEWLAFVEVCKSQLAFNPADEGVITGSLKLALHKGPWKAVWDRFCEAPKRYPNIPLQIRKCQPPKDKLFWIMDDGSYDGWPQWNENRENALRKDIISLKTLPPHEARKKILEMEKSHRRRKDLVWAEIGFSPLAIALEHLAKIAETTSNNLSAGTTKDMAIGYSIWGWNADNAVLSALSCVEQINDFEAISTAIRSIYLPWMEESSRHLQHVASLEGYPGKTKNNNTHIAKIAGECILFIDGLRFDVARRLSSLLKQLLLQVDETIVWAALPSVTATGKPAVSPVRDQIVGIIANADFEPVVAETEQSLKGGYHFKKLLTENGWTILDKNDSGNSTCCAWCEFGDIDHEGHDRGWKLAKQIDSILREIVERINSLFSAGWKKIRVVTDHGWLLMPNGLPKIDLPSSLTENKWGRCASIKPGACFNESLYPWYWNPNQYFALANGISCFKKGIEYAHGGLSLQECLTLELLIQKNKSNEQKAFLVDITDVTWRGLRCNIAVNGDYSGLILDIRSQAGNSSSSIVISPKPIKDNGIASVVVENENLDGSDATIVLLNENGQLVAQLSTKIGGDN
ncbi:MAG: BREX-1 system phosphatase PglZ type B [Desulfobacterales bacterium]|nr:BREX-1 system phosphatase PglZ type B [Desulfobacterales bacterium]